MSPVSPSLGSAAGNGHAETDSPLTNALRTAAGGYAIFAIWPVHEDGRCTCADPGGPKCAPGKHPVELPTYAPRGFKSATRDPAVIGRWYEPDEDGEQPGWNLGIACGASGVVVLDVDPKHRGDPEKVIAELGLAAYPRVRTGRAPNGVRGVHVYMRDPSGALRNSKTAMPGVEFRGDGGYVVAPPSVHSSGVRYEGDLPPVAELPEVPESVRALYESAKKAAAEPREAPNGKVPAGERRTVLLSRLGALRRQGSGEDELVTVARAWAENCCEQPTDDLFTADEGEAMARDVAKRYEAGQPTLSRPSPEASAEEVDYSPRLGAYPTFPLHALGGPARGLVEYGLRAGLPVPLVAGAALGAAAGAIGGAAEIGLAGGWTERAILWVPLLGEPGAGKTPAMGLAFAPLRAWDAEMHLWLVKQIEETEDGPKPDDRRVRVDDVTVEAVRDLLDARGGASVMDADELAAFLRSLNQYKRGGSDRDRALSLWTGAQWSAARVSGTDVLIARPTLTICGGLQTERHAELGPDGDGSRVRWLPFATQELAGAATTDDPPPRAWADTLRKLLTLRAVQRTWTLEPRAAGLFSEHRRQFKERMREGQTATVSGALAKADVALGRYALVLAEVADPGGEAGGLRVSAEVVAAAAEIVEFNLACWRALPEQDEMALSFADRELNPRIGKLIAWLERNGGKTTRRDLLRAHVAGCRNAGDVEALLELYDRNYPGSVERGVVPESGGPATTIARAPERG